MPLTVSEQFYSIQGEGRWAGVPAVFLRLTGCNLTCSGWSYKLPGTTTPLGHLGCDSKHVWSRGEKKTNAEIIAEWEGNGWVDHLRRGQGRGHLIVTGGEPMLQQDGVVSLLDDLRDSDLFEGCTTAPLDVINSLFIEVETNGTRIPSDRLCDWASAFNISLKPSSAGDRLGGGEQGAFTRRGNSSCLLPKTAMRFYRWSRTSTSSGMMSASCPRAARRIGSRSRRP